MKNKFRKIIVMALSILLVAGAISSISAIWRQKAIHDMEVIQPTESAAEVVWEGGSEEAKAAMSQEKMEEEIAKHKVNRTADATGSTAAGLTDTTSESTIDFAGLQKINPDIYAWISVPGTEIEYPILQHPTDDTHYLNYNLDGSYGYPGCIYTEKANTKDFSDPNTVIYGHNMKNGSMFAGLHKFEDKDFFDANRSVIIYTPNQTYTYQIFAAYIYDDRHLLYSFDFKNQEVYAAYLEDIFERRDMTSNIADDISVTTDDKIITLVTCMGKQPEKRLLVQAVLQK